MRVFSFPDNSVTPETWPPAFPFLSHLIYLEDPPSLLFTGCVCMCIVIPFCRLFFFFFCCSRRRAKRGEGELQNKHNATLFFSSSSLSCKKSRNNNEKLTFPLARDPFPCHLNVVPSQQLPQCNSPSAVVPVAVDCTTGDTHGQLADGGNSYSSSA